jgi:hypothetical protein
MKQISESLGKLLRIDRDNLSLFRILVNLFVSDWFLFFILHYVYRNIYFTPDCHNVTTLGSYGKNSVYWNDNNDLKLYSL